MFIFGGLFILINFLIDNVLTENLRFKPLNEEKRMDWVSNSTVQLQRVAFESRGFGMPWSGERNIVPVAGTGDKWPPLRLRPETVGKTGRPPLHHHH